MITRIEARNALLFEDLDLMLPPEAAIVGPNGSGKSSLLHLIGYGLSGKINLPGVKTDNVWQGADPSDEAYVRLHLETPEGPHVIERGLRKRRTTLSQDRRILADGEGNVNRALQRLLGVAPDVLTEMAIVGQGTVADPLIGSPAARKELLLRLVGLDEAQELLDPIEADDRATARELGRLAATDDLPRLRDELARAASERDRVAQVAAGSEIPVVVLDAAATLMVRVRDMDAVNDRLARAKVRADQTAGILREKDDARRGCQDVFVRMQGHLQQIRELRGLHDAAERSRASLSATSSPEPPRPAMFVPKEHRSALRSDDEAKRAEVADLSSQLRLVSSGTCPTCGSNVASLANPADLEQQIAERREFSAMAQAALEQSSDYDTRHETWESGCRRVEQLRQQAEQELRRVTALIGGREKPADLDVGSAEQAWDAAKAAGHRADLQHQDAQRDAHLGWAEFESAQREATARAEEVTRLREAITGRGFDPDDPRLHDPASRDASAAALQLGELSARVARLESSIAQAEQAERDRQRREAWKGVLVRGRALLGRDGLPNRLAASRLADLSWRLSEAETLLRLPFRMTFDDGLEPVAEFEDGVRRHAAGRLSGGQLVLAALAYRLALHASFAAGLGLLALDEPTEWVDQERRSLVRDALDGLVSWSRSAGMQLLLVTHHPELAALLGAEITFESPDERGRARIGTAPLL